MTKALTQTESRPYWIEPSGCSMLDYDDHCMTVRFNIAERAATIVLMDGAPLTVCEYSEPWYLAQDLSASLSGMSSVHSFYWGLSEFS